MRKSDKETFYANRGVARNKKPLRNELYKFELSDLRDRLSEERIKEMQCYKFKDDSYIVMFWKMQGDEDWSRHGFVSTEEVKRYIGNSQWGKFCQGKREFIVQRRIDNKNISKGSL